MKPISFAVFSIILLCGCVQQAFKKTIFITLTLKGRENVKIVGIRGNGKPLSWNSDYLMESVIKDSIYRAEVVTNTAFSTAEIKFTVDGSWELEGVPNRVITFEQRRDSIYYDAVYNDTTAAGTSK